MAGKGKGLQQYTVQEAGNVALGQAGSIFSDGDAQLVPPLGTVFVAITFLADSTFDGDAGGLVAELGSKFINTVEAANNFGAGDATRDEGEGGLIVDASNTFPKGATIYGRWTQIDLNAGLIIAYIGS